MSPIVYIRPGLAEGLWHTKLLAEALTKNGLQVTDQILDATIIITHSGGLHVPPKSARHHAHQARPLVLVVIDPPYWPGKPLLFSAMQTIWRETVINFGNKTVRFYIVKTLWNLKYFITDPLFSLRAVRSMRQNSPIDLLSAAHNMVIRNEHDTWCCPDIQKYIGTATFIALPGHHDDCWRRPDIYAKLLADHIQKLNILPINLNATLEM